MLKDIEFGAVEVVSATKNINHLGSAKDIIVSITMVKEEDSFSHLEGIEKLVHETNLSENGKYIKLSCTYSTNESNQVILPIKVAYRSSTERYAKKVFFDRELTPDIFEDVDFVEKFFDRTPDELKRVFM